MQAERIAERTFQRQGVRILGRCLRLALAFGGAGRTTTARAAFLAETLGITNAQTFIDNLPRERRRIRGAQDRPGVTSAEFALGQHCPYIFRQIEQAGHIGNMAAALADNLSDLFLGLAEIMGQPGICLRLFKRRQLVALDVFNQCDRERFGIVEVANDHRGFMHLGALGRTPAAFASDDFKIPGIAPRRANDQRLKNTLLADRVGQIAERFIGEVPARLQRIRNKVRNRDHTEPDSGSMRGASGINRAIRCRRRGTG